MGGVWYGRDEMKTSPYRNGYLEDVKLPRFWEYTVEKMADHKTIGDSPLDVLRWESLQ